ncbi:MAG: hypothetical protein Q9184_007511, partial [Pyrenodesmia sp. 2 TL-2023]
TIPELEPLMALTELADLKAPFESVGVVQYLTKGVPQVVVTMGEYSEGAYVGTLSLAGKRQSELGDITELNVRTLRVWAHARPEYVVPLYSISQEKKQ